MSWRVRNSRALQIGVIGLLVTCVAQVSYWIVEEARYTRETRDQMLAQFNADVPVAERLLSSGVAPEVVEGMWPHIEIVGGVASVVPEQLAILNERRRRRLNRFGWEGSFFLVALLASMGIVSQALRQRAELMRRQENFIAAVSHEFKSPLAALRLAAETLTIREPDAASVKRMADRMVQDVERLEAMVNNTLDASRISEGRLQLEPMSLDLSSEIHAVLRLSSCGAHVQGVQIESEIPDELFATADPVAFQTIMRNLVNNAVKSVTLAGGGQVLVRAAAEGKRARIEVSDSGVGFEKREASRLFDKFYRPGDELRRKSKGSGLGLYIVRRFVEESGGKLAAHSDGPERGATFTVWLPLVQEHAA